MVYDFNSFFADVGGYLGLLLGSSIFGIYETFIGMFKSLREQFKNRVIIL